MPDESCRKCSGNLTECTQCAVCKKAVSRICMRCSTRTLEEFHNYCYPVTENQHGVVTLMKNKDWRWTKRMSKLQIEFAPADRTKITFKYGITVDVPSEQTELIDELRKQAA